MNLPFTKMHGAGNDFVVLNFLDRRVSVTPALVRKLAHRRFGVGADQILILAKSTRYDFKMEIYNADGGEVEMCGNGIRCLAKFIFDRQLSAKETLTIETKAGLILPTLLLGHAGNTQDTLWVKVDMGEPVLAGELIPTLGKGNIVNSLLEPPLEAENIPESLRTRITAVSMGNPHCLIFVDNVGEVDVPTLGPVLETHAFFPRRTNVEFIQVEHRQQIQLRVWERGAGETMACGTGACAAVVGAVLNNLVDRQTTVQLAGGTLEINWDETTNHVFMTGPATTVFEGEIKV